MAKVKTKLPQPNPTTPPSWTIRDVGEVSLGTIRPGLYSGVRISGTCCPNRSLVMTAKEARQFAAALLAAAETLDTIDGKERKQ